MGCRFLLQCMKVKSESEVAQSCLTLSGLTAAAKSLQLCLTVRPHRRQPTRLLCLWDSPGKNPGVGCHFLLQRRKVKSQSEVTRSCLTRSHPMDCSLIQAPLSMGFSRQECWSGVPLPSPTKLYTCNSYLYYKSITLQLNILI